MTIHLRCKRYPLAEPPPGERNPRTQLGRYGVAVRSNRYAYILWWWRCS